MKLKPEQTRVTRLMKGISISGEPLRYLKGVLSMMEGEVHSREYIVLSRSRVCSQEQLVDVAENKGRGSFQLEIQNNNNNDNNKNKNK